MKNTFLNGMNNITPSGFISWYTDLFYNYFIPSGFTCNNELFSQGMQDEAIQALDEEGTVDAQQTVIAALVEEGDLAEAVARLDQLDDPELEDWKDMIWLYIDLKDQGRTEYELDATEEQFLGDLASECPEGIATTMAASLLHKLYGTEMPDCPESSYKNLTVENTVDPVRQTAKGNAFLGENYPNPAKETVNIPYQLPEGKPGTIKIYDVTGKLIAIHDVLPGEKTLTLEAEGWNAGVYTYSLEAEGMQTEYRQIVIVK